MQELGGWTKVNSFTILAIHTTFLLRSICLRDKTTLAQTTLPHRHRLTEFSTLRKKKDDNRSCHQILRESKSPSQEGDLGGG